MTSMTRRMPRYPEIIRLLSQQGDLLNLHAWRCPGCMTALVKYEYFSEFLCRIEDHVDYECKEKQRALNMLIKLRRQNG